MQCSKCRMTAVFFQEYSGLHLCHKHFDADIEAKAKLEIRRHRWMAHGDHIAIALSGDAISGALLFFLKKLTSFRRDIHISAIIIDEGISGYHCPETSMQIAESLDAEYIMGSFKKSFGISYDEIAHRKRMATSCTCCRGLRSFLINRIAQEHGITKVAFGYTLDDAALSVLKNVILGRPEIPANPGQNFRIGVPSFAPFIAVPEKEVALYADLHLEGFSQIPCPHYNKPFEEDIHTMLNAFSLRHPGTKYALLGLKKNLSGMCVPVAGSKHSCEKCETTADGLCETCQIINEVISNAT